MTVSVTLKVGFKAMERNGKENGTDILLSIFYVSEAMLRVLYRST